MKKPDERTKPDMRWSAMLAAVLSLLQPDESVFSVKDSRISGAPKKGAKTKPRKAGKF